MKKESTIPPTQLIKMEQKKENEEEIKLVWEIVKW